MYTGQITYYDDVGTSACGDNLAGDGDYAAISFSLAGQLNTNPMWPPSWCRRQARVTGPRGTAIVRVLDKCSGCGYGDIDVTKSIFQQIIGPLGIGRASVSWQFI